MKVSGARLVGGELVLTVDEISEAARIVYQFKPGEYELKRERKKRSLDANAYCWVLINKIAAKLKEPPVDIYRRYIRDIGCKTTVVCVKVKDVEREVADFCEGHLGRMVQYEDSKLPGCVVLHKKYGSSSFDVEEMAGFIDQICEDCRAMDIEIRPQEEIDSLLAQWGGRNE